MAEPIRELAVAALKARILTIVEPTFPLSVKACYRGRMPPSWANVLPMVVVEEDTEDAKHQPTNCVENALAVVLDGTFAYEGDSDDEPGKSANRFLASLEKALLAEWTLGGIVFNITKLGARTFFDFPDAPYVTVQLRVSVQYRTVDGDPWAAG